MLIPGTILSLHKLTGNTQTTPLYFPFLKTHWDKSVLYLSVPPSTQCIQASSENLEKRHQIFFRCLRVPTSAVPVLVPSDTFKTSPSLKIQTEMEKAPCYTLLYTVYTAYNVQTALHCLTIACMVYAYVLLGKVRF